MELINKLPEPDLENAQTATHLTEESCIICLEGFETPKSMKSKK